MRLDGSPSRCPIVLSTPSIYPFTMSEAKFNKAVEIIQALPADGAIKPTSDDQLYVRRDCSDLAALSR